MCVLSKFNTDGDETVVLHTYIASNNFANSIVAVDTGVNTKLA